MRIYLAATEDLYRGRAPVEVRRLLISYFGPEHRFLRAYQTAGSPADWCIDSGAHFFLSAYFKQNKKPPADEAEAHLLKFLRWLRKLTPKPSFVVELDLQDLYGQEVVDEWRSAYWKPFEQATGIQVAYVWHGVDGYQGWRSLLDDSDMTFLASATPKGINPKLAARYTLEAYEARKPVHGFACVKERLLRAIPYYSVDSTSWGSGSLFGTIQTFDAKFGKTRVSDVGRTAFRKDSRKVMAALLKTQGRVRVRDALGVKAGGNLSRLYANSAGAFEGLEDWYTAYWKVKGIDWEKRLAEQDTTQGIPAGR